MNNQQPGLRPTPQELMEYIDGTLAPVRYREVEQLVAQSPRLRSEVTLLQAMRRVVREDTVRPSGNFTAGVMNELLPVRKESLWFRLAKNSSNLFAMVLVLSMIGIVMVSGPGKTQRDADLFSTTVESYATAYNMAVQNVSAWMEQFVRPVNQVAATSSGKFLLIGLGVFFLFVVADELFGKRFFHARIKH
jgi:hypothetical protein